MSSNLVRRGIEKAPAADGGRYKELFQNLKLITKNYLISITSFSFRADSSSIFLVSL